MANKSSAALAPSGIRGWLDFDPFRDFEERMRQFFGVGLAPFGRLGEENCVVSAKRREKEKMCPGLGDRSPLT